MIADNHAHPDAARSAKRAGLRYVNFGEPGLHRKRQGKGFVYLDAKGKRVRDLQTQRRIASLVIPPAWNDVWICRQSNGHLQATGRDAKNRKQYRYHPHWREVRDETKYDRLIEFGHALPRIRARVQSDLAAPLPTREKILATVVRLLDLTMIRVGNEEYARTNASYGLTTLRDEHVEVRGAHVRFHFRGKAGKHHEIDIEDARLAKIVKQCQHIEGHELFQYVDDAGQRHSIGSSDVNEYLKLAAGEEFTAKDFRTWSGTVLAATALGAMAPCSSEKKAKKAMLAAIRHVAEQLGNTVAVCRKSYIHPEVVQAFLEKRLTTRSVRRVGPETTTRIASESSASSTEVVEIDAVEGRGKLIVKRHLHEQEVHVLELLRDREAPHHARAASSGNRRSA